MARIVGVTASFTPKVSTSFSNANITLMADLYRYQIMYSTTIRQMKTYIDLYTDGSFNQLTEVFTEKKLRSLMETNRDTYYYNNDVTNLIGFNYDPKVFKQYKRTIYSILTGFSLSVKQNQELAGANTENAKNQALLNSKDDLVEYIKSKIRDSMLMNSFSVSETFNVTASLKPWYIKYFELYGPPNDGVFDVEKMANVVELLISDNVITMEDFLQNK